MADFSVFTYENYMPQIPAVFDNHQVLINLWIMPNIKGEDLVLSKLAMFSLGFSLVTYTGRDVWDEEGNIKQEFLEESEDSLDEPPKLEDVDIEEQSQLQLPEYPLFV